MTDEIRTTPLTHAPSRLPKQVRRLALVLTLAITAFGATSLVAPATHAGTVPSITATGGNGQIYVTGSGFTPFGTVTVYMYNSNYSSSMSFNTTAGFSNCFLGPCSGGTINTGANVPASFDFQTDHVIAYDWGSHMWSNWSNAYVTYYLH